MEVIHIYGEKPVLLKNENITYIVTMIQIHDILVDKWCVFLCTFFNLGKY